MYQESPDASTCIACGRVGTSARLKRRPELSLQRCAVCGLVRRRTQLLERSDLESIYGSDYYDPWGLPGTFDDLWRMKIKTCLGYLDRLTPYVSREPSCPKLLDIGCAHGFMLRAAKQRGFNAFGVEISAAAAMAREQGFTVYERLPAVLSFAANSFNAVTAIDVLEHVPDPPGFLADIFRAMRPKGVLLIVTPDVGSWAATIMQGRWAHYKEEHLFYFTKRSLSVLLEKMGYHVIRMATAFKYLTFDYMVRHFEKHSPGLLTSFLRLLRSLVPLHTIKQPLYLATEMLAIAERPYVNVATA